MILKKKKEREREDVNTGLIVQFQLQWAGLELDTDKKE